MKHVRSPTAETRAVAITDWENLENESQNMPKQTQDACSRINGILAARMALPSLSLAR